MSDLPYSLENLRQLMAESTAYAQLPDQEKAKIEQYIALNDKPVLLYIYEQLQQESAALDISRDNLARKILTVKKVDQQKIKDDLQKL